MTALTAGAHVVIVAGKGGVGKTTVTAVLARAAAADGMRVLAVELDGKPTLAAALADSPVEVRYISPAAALTEYLVEHGFGWATRRLAQSGVIEVVSAAAPGIDDLVVLGKVKQLERSGAYDLIVVDGPAAGHAVTMLTSAAGLLDAVRSGPVHTQAAEVSAMLTDPERCRVVLVTQPEHTPVQELIETSDLIQDRAGVQLSGVVVNAVDVDPPPPDAVESDDARAGPASGAPGGLVRAAADASAYRRDRLAEEAAALERVQSLLALPIEVLPYEPAPPTPGTEPGPLPAPDDTMARIVADARVVVCCGSGGVGKTTTAAVLGRGAARRGRRVVVVTIDPARRLADALGMEGGLSDEPTRVPVDGVAPGGELWAMMLDARRTFERVVRRHAASPEQADRIVGNRFFGNLAGALSGTQEYMATEVLHELHGDPRFDLVVVDTPPSRHALDFLEAPGVLSRFLRHPVFRMMMLPTRAGLRVMSVATQPLLRTVGRVVGTEALADTVAFFQAFAGMEAGFRERAAAVGELLLDDTTRFVLVASPQPDTIDEAAWFADQLSSRGFRVAATVVNRMQPTFGVALDARLPDGPRWTDLARLRDRAAAERASLTPLIGPQRPPLVLVPRLARDVHGADGLDALADAIFGR